MNSKSLTVVFAGKVPAVKPRIFFRNGFWWVSRFHAHPYDKKYVNLWNDAHRFAAKLNKAILEVDHVAV